MKKVVSGCIVIVMIWACVASCCLALSLTAYYAWPKPIEYARCGKAIYRVVGNDIMSYSCDNVTPVMKLRDGSIARMGLYVAHIDEGTAILWDTAQINGEPMSCNLFYEDVGLVYTDLKPHDGYWAQGNHYSLICSGRKVSIIATLDITPKDGA